MRFRSIKLNLKNLYKGLIPFKTVNAGHSCCYSQLARLLMADRTQSGRSSMEAVHMLDSSLVYIIK